MTRWRRQRTMAQPARVEGRGYWSGLPVRVEFRPAPVDWGIRFVRDDLVASNSCTLQEATIPAQVAMRRPAARRTILATGQGPEVAMVEHVLAALAGLQIDNCEVGVTASEMPGCDGSSASFVASIEHAGVVQQEAAIDPLVVLHPVRCGEEHAWIEARPPIGDGLTIEYRLDYGSDSAIGQQWIVVDLTEAAFREEVARARTFVLKSEAEAMVAQGLAGHVQADDLLIFHDHPVDAAQCEPIGNTLRYANECVRHKVLDVVGDLALAGRPLVGHIVASCSGHRLNGDLVEALLASQDGSSEQRRSA